MKKQNPFLSLWPFPKKNYRPDPYKFAIGRIPSYKTNDPYDELVYVYDLEVYLTLHRCDLLERAIPYFDNGYASTLDEKKLKQYLGKKIQKQDVVVFQLAILDFCKNSVQFIREGKLKLKDKDFIDVVFLVNYESGITIFFKRPGNLYLSVHKLSDDELDKFLPVDNKNCPVLYLEKL